MFGSKKIKLLPEQYEIIDKLSKDVGMKKDEIGQEVFEMGLMLILLIRKGKIEETKEFFNKQMDADPKFRRFCERFEHFYDKG